MHVIRARERRRRFRGQAMVEFSIVATVLFFLLFAVLDGSLLLFTVGTTRFAAGEGSRIAAERGNAATTDQEIVTAVRATALGTTGLAIVDEIDVFRLTQDGAGNLIPDPSKVNKYRLDGTSIGAVTWPPPTRDIRNGTSDFLGLRIRFTYYWKTGIFAPAPPVRLDTTFQIRLEPQIY